MPRPPRPLLPLLSLTALPLAALPAQHGRVQSDDAKAPMYVAPASDEGRANLPGLQLADGFTAELVAAEPDLCNATAFAFDGRGRCYVCETFRVNDGVFDDRSYLQWLDEDLAATTVAERIAYYRKHLGDLAPYEARRERVRLLTDTDRDGVFDRSTVFDDGCNEMADGVIAGVLPVGDDVFVTDIPKLWRLRDTDGDGNADERTVLHDGYGVHTSLMGHDLHGLIVGPDRRLYFSIGDRGFHVETGDRTVSLPHEGAVLRCELDGSDLEIVHRGLRNPQELAFDRWGDLFTGDNNSDSGDKARLVQVVPGADSGWRIGFQWLDDRGTWNRDRLWHPRHPGQTAGILSPITNFADGPSGLDYDIGAGLPERFRDCFFLCDFRGGASYSGVRTFRLDRDGAGFVLADDDKLVWNVLATDVTFGPDGALYVLDWVHGWTKTGKGRIYRLRTKEMANDFQLRNTAQLLGADLRQRPPTQLQALLAHQDRRVRQAAQFALVDLGAVDVLRAATEARGSRMARLHGTFGLGVLARLHRADATARIEQLDELLVELLADDDADVRATAARALGDCRCGPAADALAQRLADRHPRVQREAALALARCGAQARSATTALLAGLRQNADHDAVLRHALVFALAEVADRSALLAATDDASPAVQRGVLLALARRSDAEVARFLRSSDEQLRFEAARAIYEQPIAAAMEPLARLCFVDDPDSERVLMRAIQANRALGEVENGEVLVFVASRTGHPLPVRREALQVLAEWLGPDEQCRLTGLWRPVPRNNPRTVADCFAGMLEQLLLDPAIAADAARTTARLHLVRMSPLLADACRNPAAPDEARLAALDALAELGAGELAPLLASFDGSTPLLLKKRAIELLSRSAPEQAVPLLASLLDGSDSDGERQAACKALGELQHPAATSVLRVWAERLVGDGVPPAIRLDIHEAAAKHEALAPLLAMVDEAAAARGPTGPFHDCLEGGDADRGRRVFHDHEATRCTRCHSLQDRGGNAGPKLDGVGLRLHPELLLESLIVPGARIADGFATTILQLHDGGVVAGVLTRDQDGVVTVVPLDGKPVDVPAAKIASRRTTTDSAMPAMGSALSRWQIRDLIAFLQAQR